MFTGFGPELRRRVLQLVDEYIEESLHQGMEIGDLADFATYLESVAKDEANTSHYSIMCDDTVERD